VVVGTGMGHSEASQGKQRNLGEMHCSVKRFGN
jgi:hypothetical protein